MSDACAVRFRESPPGPACGPVLHRAFVGGRTILVEFRFLAAKAPRAAGPERRRGVANGRL